MLTKSLPEFKIGSCHAMKFSKEFKAQAQHAKKVLAGVQNSVSACWESLSRNSKWAYDMPQSSLEGLKTRFQHVKKVLAGVQNSVSACWQSLCRNGSYLEILRRSPKLNVGILRKSLSVFKIQSRHAEKVFARIQNRLMTCHEVL